VTQKARTLGGRIWQAAPDLVIASALTLLALLLGMLARDNVIFAALSALLVLVLPGYVSFAALNARLGPIFSTRQAPGSSEGLRDPTRHTEGILLTLALSVAIVVLGSLVLNALPAGMTRITWLVSLSLATLAVAAFATWTRLNSRPAVAPPAKPPASSSALPSARDYALFASTAVVLGLALGLGGVGAPERPRDPFTQLWALPRPDNSTVEVGIRNEEGRIVTYHLFATSGDILLTDEANIRLAAGETWQRQLPLAIQGTGRGIDVLLYRDDAPLSVYRSVRLAAPSEETP
jgi:uncharacterized membrane protein